ncbi:MAG TPA: PaaI family thioesterase [Gaiellaceae bacterium]|nr:PaaI family thioesterase [Gaiellaceae bacterium]
MSDERTRTYSWDDPFAVLEHGSGLSGLEIMQRMVTGELPQPPIAETLGFRLVEAERGRAVFECEPAEFHYNPIGTVHAGLASTLLDSAMGCAFVTTLDAGVGWTTLELKANFTRPLTTDTGRVRCIGTVIHPGRTVATTEARIEDETGRLYAHATSTILVLSDGSR